MPLPQKKLIPGLLLILMIAAIAAPPLWWSNSNPPVLNSNPANNHGPANIGQAKHMAKSALDSLALILPTTAAAIEADLVGPGKPIPSWNPPANQAEKDKNHAPLLLGQLKAIAHPFYNHLNTAAPAWLTAERIGNGNNHSGSIFPWTTGTTDDQNKAIANIGQLKAVFSLRFSETDTDGDNLPDLYELAYGLDPENSSDGYPDLVGDTNSDGIGDALAVLLGLSPLLGDSDGDGVPDSQDAFPNDPDRSKPGIIYPSDTIKPTVAILVPQGSQYLTGP